MQRNEMLWTAVLVLAVMAAPPATSSVRPGTMPGEWHQTAASEQRAPGHVAGVDWDIEGTAGNVESRLTTRGQDAATEHRVLFTWNAIPDTLRAGDGVPVDLTALVLEASEAFPAAAKVEVSCWTSVSSALPDRVPAGAVTVASATLAAGDPPGAVARVQGSLRPPQGPEGDVLTSGALFVRVTIGHGASELSYTRTYVWTPALVTASAATGD